MEVWRLPSLGLLSCKLKSSRSWLSIRQRVLKTKKPCKTEVLQGFVPQAGLEPALEYYSNWILSPTCLPIPPLRHCVGDKAPNIQL